ncbi:acyl-CoA thioesterase [Glutamicibacter creatinolyticus]|uniref:acyl-CoA thioesterase n=1 Tax=Glutamicibacter creatinolyticus TaxID=162496 RepID=UPI0037BF222C
MSQTSPIPTGGTDIEIQLRWSDEDKLGHVNNARIVTLMEEARVRWLRRDGIVERFGNGLVVAALQINYLKPLYYRPSMTVRMGVDRIGAKSFALRHLGYQDGQVAFDGTTVMVALDTDGVSSRLPTPAEREWLQDQMLSVGNA